MLDRPSSKSPFRKSFDEWWNAQSQEFQKRTDVDHLPSWIHSGWA